MGTMNSQLTPDSNTPPLNPAPPAPPTAGQTTPTPVSFHPDGGPLGQAALGALKGAESAHNPQSPVYLDEQGNPKPSSPIYLDENGEPIHSAPIETPAPQRGMLENIAGGVEKGAAKTIVGLGNLAADAAERILHLPDGSLHASVSDNEQPSVARNIGEFGENAGEFVAGGEVGKLAESAPALKGIVAMSHLPEPVLALMEKYPTAAKIFTSAAKNAAVGAAQGGVKGAAEGNTKRDAEAGAAGGAIGGALAESAPILTKILRKTGLGGLSPEENITKAAGGSLNVNTKDWSGTLEKALPLIKDTKFKTVGEFADAVHDAADNLWTQTIQPQVDRHAGELLDMSPIRKDIRGAITDTLREHFPDEAAQMEKFADTFAKPKTVSGINQAIQEFNARLKSYYRMSNEGQAAATKSVSEINALETAVSGMRDALYTHLEKEGEVAPAEFRQQYGALKEIEKVFDKRATVADRQAPMNITQVASWIAGVGGAITAVTTGHPLDVTAAAGFPAAAAILKHGQLPATLLKRGIAGAAEEAAPSAVKAAVKSGVKAAIPAAAATAARGAVTPSQPQSNAHAENMPVLPANYSHIKTSQGDEMYIPNEHLDKARGIDAGLQLIRQGVPS